MGLIQKIRDVMILKKDTVLLNFPKQIHMTKLLDILYIDEIKKL